MSLRTLCLLALIPLVACGEADSSAVSRNDSSAEQAFSTPLSTAETNGVLVVANTADFSTLDEVVGLDRRAAQGIVDRRPFATLDALDAAPYVGDAALAQLVEYAEAQGLIVGAATVHGIEEGSELARAVLRIANLASQEVLDDAVGLDRRAAENIVVDRPFADLAELDEVAYVSASAFDRLAAYAELSPMSDEDADGDGYGSSMDCDDTDADVHPDAVELCDGIDNDCDPTTLEAGLVTADGANIPLAQATQHASIAICAGTWPDTLWFSQGSFVVEGIGAPEDIVLTGRVKVGAYLWSSDLELRNLTIAGSGVLASGNALTLDGVIVRDTTNGLTAELEAQVTVRNSTFSNNSVAGIWVRTDAEVEVWDSALVDHPLRAIDVDGADVTVRDSAILRNGMGAQVKANTWTNPWSTFESIRTDFGAGVDENDDDVRVTVPGMNRYYRQYGANASFRCVAHDSNTLGAASVACAATP